MIVKKTRDAEATRARIIEVAEEAFAEKGFAGTSIRDIARQSKCSGPLILFHFKSKEGLYTKVKEGILDRCKIKLSLEEEGKISTSVYLERMIARLFEFYRDNPNLLRLANWGRMEGDIAPWPGEVEMDEIVEKKIVEAQKNGEIRNDLEPFTIITMITGAA